MSNIKMSKSIENIKLSNKTPALFVDGNVLAINENGFGELVFFQIEKTTGEKVEATGIGTYRMPIEQLEALKTTIENTIDTHNKKQKNKK